MTTKKQVATMLILVVMGMIGLVSAQDTPMIKAQVPFNFVANGKVMPAGECVITVVGPSRRQISISSGKQHTYASSIPNDSATARNKTALVFHRYGDRYFLTGIKREGRNGYQLLTGRLELELQALNVPGQDFTLLASTK